MCLFYVCYVEKLGWIVWINEWNKEWMNEIEIIRRMKERENSKRTCENLNEKSCANSFEIYGKWKAKKKIYL